jgi:hypothetical protein
MLFRLTIVPDFQSVTLTNSTLSLTWSKEAGLRYQSHYNSDLSSSNWSSLGRPLTATGAALSTADIVTNASQRFYRLALSPYGFNRSLPKSDSAPFQRRPVPGSATAIPVKRISDRGKKRRFSQKAAGLLFKDNSHDRKVPRTKCP